MGMGFKCHQSIPSSFSVMHTKSWERGNVVNYKSINIGIIIFLRFFQGSFNWWVFIGILCLRDSWRGYLSILSNFSSDMLLTVSNLPLSSSRLFCMFLRIFLRVPVTIGTTLTFTFQSFFSFLTRFRYWLISLVSLSGLLEHQSPRDDKFFFLLIRTRFDHLVWIRLSVSISRTQSILCFSLFWRDSGLSTYYLNVQWNFSLLHNFKWITFPTQSYLFLYSFLPVRYICLRDSP